VNRVWNQILLDEGTQVPLLRVPNVREQPGCALLYQVGSQGDSLDGGQSEQMTNRWERFTSADCHKEVVTFNHSQVRLDGFSERPCQVDFLHEWGHSHRPLVFRSGPRLQRSATSNQQRRVDSVMSPKNLYELPRADHAQSALI
jgi:hypothetical protein